MSEQFDGIPEIDPQSWLARAFEYARSRSQLPDPAIFWTLCAFCGAALQDSIYVNWAVKPIYPNLPLLIVGESGLGKTGAKNTIAPLFERCLPMRAAEDSTAEALTKDLAIHGRSRHGNTAGFWIVPELADVLGQKDYQQGAIARLTRLFDNPKDREVSRAGQQGRTTLQGYCVLSWVAGTTFEWLHKHVDEAVSAGGFMPRLLVLNCDQPLKKVPNPQRDLAIESRLNAELVQLLNSGGWQPRAMSLGKCWDTVFDRIFDARNNARGTPVAPFIARRAENLLRISLIINQFGTIRCDSVAFGDDFSTPERCAIWFENQAVSVAMKLQNSVIRCALTTLEDYVKTKQCVSFAAVMKNLNVLSKDLRGLLLELSAKGTIKWDGLTGSKSKIEWIGE